VFVIHTVPKSKIKNSSFLSKVKSQKIFIIMLLPFLVHIILFRYVPMYGNLIAFKDYSFTKGIIGSPWAGFKYFKYFFNSPDLLVVMRNTVVISMLSLIFTTVGSIAFAVFICEVQQKMLKKFIQTVSYLPHFISWIVVVGMAMTLFSIDGGPVNEMLVNLKLVKEPVNFLGDVDLFWPFITFLNLWKNIGWNSIIYIAAITSIDKQMYESAIIDGANKLKQIFYITLPVIKPTIIMLLILSLGYVLNAGLDQQFFLQNPMNLSHAEVLDTYIVKYGLQQFNFSYGTAVGLFRSAVSLIFVIFANLLSRKFLKMGLF
jgi:putative aldouronate transport system permease protein